MGGSRNSTYSAYNPFSNINVYTDLQVLEKERYITNLSINSEAFKRDLFITFRLTNQDIDGIQHGFDFEKYQILLLRNELFSEPTIFIKYPKLPPNTPHLHLSGNLCLYHSKHFKWIESMSVRNTIIPWTFLWAYYYEVWLIKGDWLGPEVSH